MLQCIFLNHLETYMKNRTEIETAVNEIATDLGASVNWGREDGYTWLTLEGGSVSPLRFDIISQSLADATGRSFFFHSAGFKSIEGPIDADMPYHMSANKVPDSYIEKGRDIQDYGHEFKPLKS